MHSRPHLIGAFLLKGDAPVTLAVHLACFWGAALLSSPTRKWSLPRLSFALALLGALMPWKTCEASELGRVWYGLAGIIVFARYCQMISWERRPRFYLQRLSFIYWIGADLRTAKQVSSSTAHRDLVKSFLCEGASALCITIIVSALLPLVRTLTPLNLAVLFVLFYFSLIVMDCVYNAPLLIAEKISVERVMDSPFSAKSVKDFWVRWDKPVQSILRDSVYIPLRRRLGAPAAIMATFITSGILHSYGLVLGGCTTGPAFSMLLFFVIQPLVMRIEIERRWPLFVFYLLPTAPLFLYPLSLLLSQD